MTRNKQKVWDTACRPCAGLDSDQGHEKTRTREAIVKMAGFVKAGLDSDQGLQVATRAQISGWAAGLDGRGDSDWPAARSWSVVVEER